MEKRVYRWRCKAFDEKGQVLIESPIKLYGYRWPIQATGGGSYNDFDVDVCPGETRLCDGDVLLHFDELEKSSFDSVKDIKVIEVTNDLELVSLSVKSLYPIAIEEDEDGLCATDFVCKYDTGILTNITPIDFASRSGDEPSTPRNSVES